MHYGPSVQTLLRGVGCSPPNQKKKKRGKKRERGEEERRKEEKQEKRDRGIKRERKLKLSFPEYVVMGL